MAEAVLFCALFVGRKVAPFDLTVDLVVPLQPPQVCASLDRKSSATTRPPSTNNGVLFGWSGGGGVPDASTNSICIRRPPFEGERLGRRLGDLLFQGLRHVPLSNLAIHALYLRLGLFDDGE